jgi:hypothetical protein
MRVVPSDVAEEKAAMTDTQKPATSTTAKAFTDEERDAMRERAKEQKAMC